MDNISAFKQLEALAAIPGALKVVTNVHLCQELPSGRPAQASDPEFDNAACAAFDVHAGHARHQVLHDVTHIEVTDNGVVAHTDEGDWCSGEPSAVLARLTEHVH